MWCALNEVGRVACYGPLRTHVAYPRLPRHVIALESVSMEWEVLASLRPVVREDVNVMGPVRVVGIACRMYWGHWKSRQKRLMAFSSSIAGGGRCRVFSAFCASCQAISHLSQASIHTGNGCRSSSANRSSISRSSCSRTRPRVFTTASPPASKRPIFT